MRSRRVALLSVCACLRPSAGFVRERNLRSEAASSALRLRGGASPPAGGYSWEDRAQNPRRPPAAYYDDEHYRPAPNGRAAAGRGKRGRSGRPVERSLVTPVAAHLLVMINIIVYLVGRFMPYLPADALALHHDKPKLWQLVTSLFWHSSQMHLMGNMFALLVFGKMVEEDLGKSALLGSFLVCGAASNAISLWMHAPFTKSCGASGAIFGLYSISVLSKFWPPAGASKTTRARSLVDAVVFGWFVGGQLLEEIAEALEGSPTNVNYAAHFAGITAGAVVIWALRRDASAGPQHSESDHLYDMADPREAPPRRARPEPAEPYVKRRGGGGRPSR